MIRLEDYAEDVFVELIDFKDNPAEEVVTKNADGSYTIFINARAAHDRQVEALEHARRHIAKDDFTREDIQQIEAEAHQIVEQAAEQKPDELEQKIQKILKRRKRRRKKFQRQLEEYEKFVEMRLKCDEQYYKDHYLF